MPAVPAVSDEEFEPDDDAVDRDEHSGDGIGRAAEKADGPTDQDGRQHGCHDEAFASKADGGFVAGNACERADEPKPGGDDGWREHGRCTRAGRYCHVSKERDAPAAQRAHLQRVDAVGDRIRHRRPVPEHRPEIVEALSVFGWGGALGLRGNDQRHREPRDRGAHGGGKEGGAPAGSGGDKVASSKRKGARNANARGMAGRGARHHLRVDPIGQELEARHVRARPAHAGQRPHRKCRPEAVGKQRKHQVTEHGRRHAEEIDAFGIHAVRQSDEHGHRNHVGAVKAGRDPARLAVGELPERHHAGQQRRPEEGADLHQHLCGADDRNQPARRSRECGRADGHECESSTRCVSQRLYHISIMLEI